MSAFTRELVILILQFLDEEKYKETAHKLEQESGIFFNMKYFEEEVQNGNWDEVEKYLSGFTKVDENKFSMKMFFMIRKQKYLEALDKHDRHKAVDILVNDLEVFASVNEDTFKEMTQLLTLKNFRKNERLSEYVDAKSARATMLVELKMLIGANPLFRNKLQFPNFKNSRLGYLINQSLNWQHHLCKNPNPNPDISTLIVDHSCDRPNVVHAWSSASSPLFGSLPIARGFLTPGRSMPSPAPFPASLAGWMSNLPAFPVVSGGAIGLSSSRTPVPILNRPRAPPPSNPTFDYSSVDSNLVSKRARTFGITGEANQPGNLLPVAYPQHRQLSHITDELPKTVAQTLDQDSSPTSMDFHPTLHTLLLVGTNVGDIGIWDVSIGEKIARRNFKVWDVMAHTTLLQNTLVKDPAVSVNHVKWSPDGSLFGVAYSKHIVQIYSYLGGDAIRQHLEIDAHVGGVNDLAFAQPNKQLCLITCGDDKLIKVWDAVSGAKQYIFDGHEAPVYSVCTHVKPNTKSFFSTSLDGKIRVWFYNNIGPKIEFDAPGRWCTTMAYSADGFRLFSCGTSKEGESCLVEWNASGAVKRTYHGFCKRSSGAVQFDTTKNRYLAAGDESVIKIWDMDAANLLTTVEVDGGLLASPHIRFNKEGSLMAVSANNNVIQILANADGLRLLRTSESRLSDASRTRTENVTKPITDPLAAVATCTNSEVMDKASPSVAITGMPITDPLAAAATGTNSELMDKASPSVAITEMPIPNPLAAAGTNSEVMDKASSSVAITEMPITNPLAAAADTDSEADMDKASPSVAITELDGDSRNIKPKITVEMSDKSNVQKLTENYVSTQCRSLRLTSNIRTSKISRLIYTNSGTEILALASNGIHLLWKWPCTPPGGKATASVSPQLWQPSSGITMTNDTSNANPDESVSCFAVSKNSSYVMSASGGKISLFNMFTFKKITTFMPSPPAATFIAFHPLDNNIIAIGMEDSSIQIYNVPVDVVKTKLKGHSKRITGLAFSSSLHVLVSSGADAQIVVWGTEGWEKQRSKELRVPTTAASDTHVEFHRDEMQLLAVHETQIALYDATGLDRTQQWVPQEGSAPISHAAFSCDGRSVYACLRDGAVCVLDASDLKPRCRISPACYLPANIGSSVHPTVVAAHPTEPNRFALGLTDGDVCVIEPMEPEGSWGASPSPANNGSPCSSQRPPSPDSQNQASLQVAAEVSVNW